MKKLNKLGFTMIELLVVLLIIGILAAVAAPLFLGNADRAKASEAVAALGMIRQAEREYFVKHNTYLLIAKGDLSKDPEATSGNKGLGITIGASKYFSDASYTVGIGTALPMGDSNTAADFLAIADGSQSVAFAGGVGARNNTDVANMTVQMDNTGHTIYENVPGAATTADWKTF